MRSPAVHLDPHLLADATATLSARHGIAREQISSWRVRRTITRPRSVLHHLVADVRGLPGLECFYKSYVSADGPTRSRQQRMHEQALIRSMEVRAPLVEALNGLGVEASVPLAVDVPLLSAVFSFVPGTELGKVYQRALPFRRASARMAYRRLGAAIRAVEEVGRRWQVDASDDSSSPTLDARVSTSEHLPEPAKVSLCAHIDHLCTSGGSRLQLVGVHGDMSPTNVLVNGPHVGLIDFVWLLRPPGHGVFQLFNCLDLERPRWPAWTNQLKRELLHGYDVSTEDRRVSLVIAEIDGYLRILESRDPRKVSHRWARERLLRLSQVSSRELTVVDVASPALSR